MPRSVVLAQQREVLKVHIGVAGEERKQDDLKEADDIRAARRRIQPDLPSDLFV